MKAELLFLILTFGDLPSVLGRSLNFSAVVGGNITLPCKAEKFLPLEVVEWSRPGTDIEFVLIFKTQHRDLDVPKESYQGRVELKDREKGDMSLVLRNVTAEDEGTYECYVLAEREHRKSAEHQPNSTVYLHVAPPPSPPPPSPPSPSPSPPPPSGQQLLGLFVGVVLFVLVVLVVAAVFVWKKKNSLHPPPSLNEGVETAEVRLNVEDHSEPTSDSSPFLDELTQPSGTHMLLMPVPSPE